MIDKSQIEEAVKLIIDAIGEDKEREGLIQTPLRIANMYEEIFAGLDMDTDEILSKTFAVDEEDLPVKTDLVLEKDITFYSMCEHHFLPFYGKAHVAYIPGDRVVGLSKIARTVDVFSKRPQLQERLTSQICDAIMEKLNAKGVMVVIEAEHMCMTMRGVKKPSSLTMTIACAGDFTDNGNLKDNVLTMIRG